MTPGLKVLASGLCTTVQDVGRFGYQNIGVPVSGALDSFGLRLANALAGNPQATAALEILISGPTLEVAAETIRVALTGAGASLGIGGKRPKTVAAGQSVTLRRGEVVQIAPGRQSACCYLAVEGGIAVPRVLGSASTYVRAALGGLNGRALQHGDLVPLAAERASERSELRAPAPPAAPPGQPVRVVLGPQHKYFKKESLAALFDAEFRVSKDADRMGMRLDGPPLQHKRGWDIVSDAIATGSIQVPGSGQPIVLLADHQTTGGYPKIATVISTDLPAVGRRRPGDPLRFVPVELEEAEEICRRAEREFAKLIAAFEPVPSDRSPEVELLYDENLISGVTTGLE
ncbi:MAG: biotin-dependent carboxyltransferase family protein [Alphaproteobacteria bacterium]|nr:biotin-dependent carboxyltransferase family protein [Alphaproteobacteria bacterium]